MKPSRKATSDRVARFACWRARARLIVVAVLAAACQGATVQEGMTWLDSELLASLNEVLSPIPRFSGGPQAKARFRPTEQPTCPPALAQTAPLHVEALRPKLAHLSRRVARFRYAHAHSAPALRIEALWTLLGDPTPRGRDHVVNLLQDALELAPREGSRRNDLAAAYLVRASLDGRADDLPQALDLLDQDPGPLHLATAVRVNRAYALQCLSLWREAQETWRFLAPGGSVLPIPRPTPQAAPSTTISRLDDLLKDPLAARRRGEWLLGEWALHHLGGRSARAEGALEDAERIAAHLERAGGDGLLRASVAVVRSAGASGDRARLAALAHGHATFHSIRGDAIYADCRPAELRSAEAQLGAAGSPFVGWVQLDDAGCAYFSKDFSRATRIATAVEASAGSRGWIALQARSEWLLGLLSIVRARFVESSRYYSHAIALFSRVGEDSHVAYLHSLKAKAYQYGGARLAAWHERLAALTQRARIQDPERLFTIYYEAAEAMQADGHPVAALAFLSEQMRAAIAGAEQTGKTDLLVYTLLARSSLLDHMGRRAESLDAVAQAEAAWRRLDGNNESRRELRVRIDVQQALLDEGSSGAGARAALDRAQVFFAGRWRSLGEQIEVLRLHQLRARFDESRRDYAAARKELLLGADEIERQRLDFASMEDRAGFLSQRRALFLDLVRLELDKLHDPLSALDAFERGTNRILLDNTEAPLAGMSRPLPSYDLGAALPAGTLVVRFGHLQDRLLIWTFLGGSMGFEQRPMPAAELIRKVQRCRSVLAREAAGPEPEAPCNALAQDLLPKRLQELAAGGSVLVIPDEATAPLPFAALRTAPDAPFLIERYFLSYAPSLTLLLTLDSTPLAAPHPAPRSALFIADPEFNTDLFPFLPRLPAARQAGLRYAAHYPHAEVIDGRRATIPNVLAALQRVELLEFDGHGLTNAQAPELGGLLLAPDSRSPASSTVLTAADLPPGLHRRLRLVILGACSTGLTAYRDSAEVAGLVATFIARGVPEVVASAWEVQDDRTAELLDRLHQALAAGLPAAAALRSAQLALLRLRPADPDTSTWAAFQVFQGAKRSAPSVYERERPTFRQPAFTEGMR